MAREHLSVAICGHVDSGKTSLAARMLFLLGGLSEREQALLPYPSYCPWLILDCSKEERERGLTITCKRRQLVTETWCFTLIDTPGHSQFIKNTLAGASQADAAILVVPADGSFKSALCEASRMSVEGGSRLHGQLLNLLGVQQLCVVVNKMDCDVAAWRRERFEEVAAEVRRVLLRVGWRRAAVEKTPVIPISALAGDNLIRRSYRMEWWTGQDVLVDGRRENVLTVYDVLEKVFRPPARLIDGPLCMPVTNTYSRPGVGTVVLGRLERGALNPGEQVLFLPDRAGEACSGIAVSIEMHQQNRDVAAAGDIIGINIRGLPYLPRSGDIMMRVSEVTGGNVLRFDAQVLVMGSRSPVKAGYCALAVGRSGRAPCRLLAIRWKMSKPSARGSPAKTEAPASVAPREMALCTFEPLRPFCCETFKSEPSLSRIVFLDGNVPAMIGKVASCEHRGEANDKGGKKK